MPDLITILGPTASGKTALAVHLAQNINAEIISADSRQVYKNMDIGTGKDLADYGTIPYHLIDILPAGASYNVANFQEDFQKVFQNLKAQHKTAILCGGTGLYLQAVLQGFDFTFVPINNQLRKKLDNENYETLLAIFVSHEGGFSGKADVSTKKRLIRAIEINKFLTKNPHYHAPIQQKIVSKTFGLNPELQLRRDLITQRLANRLENGLINEVESLLQNGVPSDKLIFYGLEYKFVCQYLQGEFTYNVLFERLNIAIHQFAKRQMTFFRKMEKDGILIDWIPADLNSTERVSYILSKL